MISTRHSLDDARIVHKEALSLANAGHEVVLVFTCNNNYEYLRTDKKIITVGHSPKGEVDYKGLKVFGLPKRSGLLGKLRMFFELSNLSANIKADVYHAHESDLSLIIAIRAKKLLFKQKINSLVVHDMHEYPPGEPYDKAPRFFKSLILLTYVLWDMLLIKRVDQVFTANNIVRGYALTLSYRMSVDVLFNGPILKLFPQPTIKILPRQCKKVLLCHEGALPFDRGLKEMIEAIFHLQDKVSLRIVGDVFGEEKKWLLKEIEKNCLKDSIQITGWLPYEKVSAAMNDCHAGLILFRDCIENRLAGPPNKLFNYMNAGLPVLSVDFPEMRQIIMEEKCGILIHDQSVKSIIGAIETFLINPENMCTMSKNGQQAIRERYSWELMERKLLFSYKRLSKIVH